MVLLVIVVVMSFAFKGIEMFYVIVGLVDLDRGLVVMVFAVLVVWFEIVVVIIVWSYVIEVDVWRVVGDRMVSVAWVLFVDLMVLVILGGAVGVRMFIDVNVGIVGEVVILVVKGFASGINAQGLVIVVVMVLLLMYFDVVWL